MNNTAFDFNPELKKNIWLELSGNRLLITPILLTGIYFLVYLLSTDSAEFTEKAEIWSIVMFSILIFIYGTRLASEAIIEEVNERTWDNQRMTLVSPWMMSFGKLFGSTIYAWYGGIYCMLVYFVCCFYLPYSFDRIKFGVILILIAVFTHSLSISLSLIGIKKNRQKAKIQSSFYFIAAIVLSGYLLYYAFMILHHKDVELHWYIFEMGISNFGIITILFFSFWGIISLYRNMRTEFQFKNGPLIWIVFLTSLILYIAGLSANSKETFILQLTLSFSVGYAIVITTTYFMAFSEPKYIVDFRLLMSNIKNKNWNEFTYNVPLWVISLAFVVIICPLLIILFMLPELKISSEEAKITSLYPLSILCFLLRDICLLIFLNLSDKAKRADVTALLYLLLLYVLIPSILGAGNLKEALPVFIPMPSDNFLIGTVPVFLQFLVMGYMVYRRYSGMNRGLVG